MQREKWTRDTPRKLREARALRESWDELRAMVAVNVANSETLLAQVLERAGEPAQAGLEPVSLLAADRSLH